VTKKRHSAVQILIAVIACLMLLCAAVALLSWGANRRLAAVDVGQNELSTLDLARWQESVHLRAEFGDAVWPGWGQADIPTVLYNAEYAFLLGLPLPEAGWRLVPRDAQQGTAWEPVLPEPITVPYLRQVLQGEARPQAFAMLVGDRWVASMATEESMRVSLATEIRAGLPRGPGVVFPAAWMANLLLPDTDTYISLLSHESFHAYVGLVAPERLWAAERVGMTASEAYPWPDQVLRGAWKQELSILGEALDADDLDTTVALSQEFVAHREQRRSGLSPESVLYEQDREWSEGLARYAELEIWRLASLAEDYSPAEGMALDDGYHRYSHFRARWSRELQQIARMANDEGDGRFYYSGMAQAYLLDRLAPGWKDNALDAGVHLDDVLADALLRPPVP
jgi:hypothetical protein